MEARIVRRMVGRPFPVGKHLNRPAKHVDHARLRRRAQVIAAHAMAFTGARGLGAITPIGGVAFMVGWAALAVAAARLSWT